MVFWCILFKNNLDVFEAIGKEPKHYKLQIPEIRSNLLQPKRSLADKISTKGATKLYQQRTLRWLECHRECYIVNVTVLSLFCEVKENLIYFKLTCRSQLRERRKKNQKLNSSSTHVYEKLNTGKKTLEPDIFYICKLCEKII